jgi:uncharacterized protein (TIGR00730 family)
MGIIAVSVKLYNHKKMKSITIFCGSNFGRGDAYRNAAQALGRELARRGLTMVYGGTNKGTMGVLADTVLAAGGTVHGVITRRLADKGHSHPDVKTVEVLESMRERKSRMAVIGDAYIALPGGVGTLEEFFEVWVAAQLEGIPKPLGLLNVNGYFDPLMMMITRMIEEEFLPAAHRDMIVVASDPAALLDGFARYVPVTVQKWL